ncbi:MAG: hypothetical protein V4622_11365 [Bacteroidota bacterium]
MTSFIFAFHLLFSSFSNDNGIFSLNSEVKIPQESQEIETNYDNLYIFQSQERDVMQKLYVKYIDSTKIDFKIDLVRMNCQTEFSGVALTDLNVDSEIDEDEDGNAYMATEFKLETDDFFFAIRISEDKEKVKILYVKTKEEVDKCPFILDKLIYSE